MKVLLMTSAAIITSCNGYARKELPDHIERLVQDPAKKIHVPGHTLSREDILAHSQMSHREKDPHFRTSDDLIPRVPDDFVAKIAEIHSEEQKTYFTESHKKQAYKEHKASINNRDKIEKKALHNAQRYNISQGLTTHEDHTVVFDADTRVARPPPTTDVKHDYLQNMMMLVHFRRELMMDSQEREMLDGWMIGIERELIEHNIYYQSLSKRDTDSVQIMCNDAEERNHILHLLLKYDFILSVDIEGMRYFTKWADQTEIDTFQYMKSLDPEKKAKLQELQKREAAFAEAERISIAAERAGIVQN